jgi:hypothetical protein
MVAKIGNENACRVFNWNIDGKMIAYNFCIVKGDDSMINAFNGLAMSLFDQVNEIIPVSAVAVAPNGAELKVEYLKNGDAKSEVLSILLEEESVNLKDGNPLLSY